jgi:hypothetical protein
MGSCRREVGMKEGTTEGELSITARFVANCKQDNELRTTQYYSPHRFAVSSMSLLFTDGGHGQVHASNDLLACVSAARDNGWYAKHSL